MTADQVALLIGAIGVFLTSCAAWLKGHSNGGKLDVIGLNVDGNLTAARLEIRNLTTALLAAGIPLPDPVPVPAAVPAVNLTPPEVAHLRTLIPADTPLPRPPL